MTYWVSWTQTTSFSVAKRVAGVVYQPGGSSPGLFHALFIHGGPQERSTRADLPLRVATSSVPYTQEDLQLSRISCIKFLACCMLYVLPKASSIKRGQLRKTS